MTKKKKDNNDGGKPTPSGGPWPPVWPSANGGVDGGTINPFEYWIGC